MESPLTPSVNHRPIMRPTIANLPISTSGVDMTLPGQLSFLGHKFPISQGLPKALRSFYFVCSVRVR